MRRSNGERCRYDVYTRRSQIWRSSDRAGSELVCFRVGVSMSTMTPALRAAARSAYRDLLRASSSTFAGMQAFCASGQPSNDFTGDEPVQRGIRAFLQRHFVFILS